MLNISGVGRLSKDPKMQYTPKGTAQTMLSLAVNTGFGDNAKTVWLSLICWGATAELINEKFSKGDRIEFIAEATDLYTYSKDDGSTGGSLNAKLLSFAWVDKSTKKNDAKEESVEEAFEWEE